MIWPYGCDAYELMLAMASDIHVEDVMLQRQFQNWRVMVPVFAARRHSIKHSKVKRLHRVSRTACLGPDMITAKGARLEALRPWRSWGGSAVARPEVSAGSPSAWSTSAERTRWLAPSPWKVRATLLMEVGTLTADPLASEGAGHGPCRSTRPQYRS